MSGINQDVEVLGKTLHLQTQISQTPDPCIRTEVFFGGKLVATRELLLSTLSAPDDPAGLQIQMKAHHKRILRSVMARAEHYQANQADNTESEGPTGPLPVGRTKKRLQEPQVEIALRVRRLYEQFRMRLLLPKEPSKNLTDRLEHAAREFDWIFGSPIFDRVRLDEQLRFNLLADHIKEWMESERNAVRAAQIWSEILEFVKYLGKVNDRSELAAFDRDLLRWAIRTVEEKGLSDRTLEHLGMIHGRDEELDNLLEDPSSATYDVWLSHFRRVLAGLERMEEELANT